MEVLALLLGLLCLVLTLSTALTILKNTVGAADRRKQLCLCRQQSLPLLNTVRDHERLVLTLLRPHFFVNRLIHLHLLLGFFWNQFAHGRGGVLVKRRIHTQVKVLRSMGHIVVFIGEQLAIL